MSKKRKINRLVRIYAERELAEQIKLESRTACLNKRKEIREIVMKYKENNSHVKNLTSTSNLYQTNKG